MKPFNEKTSRGTDRRRYKVFWLGMFAVLLTVGGYWIWRQVRIEQGKTQLIAAVETGDTEKVRLLLQVGVDPNVRRVSRAESFTWQRVFGALRSGDSTSPYEAETVLILAAAKDRAEIVQMLLEHGADVNARDHPARGWTALHFAADRGAVHALKVLLDHGADVNALTGWHETALFHAMKFEAFAWGDLAGIPPEQSPMGVLLDHGADVKVQGQHAETPLLYAATIPQHAMSLRLLLAHGAGANQAGPNGTTALMGASTWGRAEGVQALLAKGARVNDQDSNGNSALHYAVQILNTKKMILAAHQDVRTQYLDVIRVLLDHGADPRLKNRAGQTARQLAQSLNEPEAARLLQDARTQ